MPRRLRKLLGLAKVEDGHGYKAPKETPTVASGATAPLPVGHGTVDRGRTHNTPSHAEDTDGAQDGTLFSGRNATFSQTMAVDSNTTGSLGQASLYWERAARQLEEKEPSVFAALQEIRKESSCTSKDMPREITQIIEQHRNTMENKQWSLPFKVRGREVNIRKQLDNVWRALQTFNAVGSALASLDPVHAGIPWAGVSFIVQGALNDSAQNTAAMEGLSRISPIVDRYLLIETIYLGVQDRGRLEDFEKTLVDLYASILKYQVAAACHCKRSTFSRFLRNLPKVDDWAKMLNDIDKKDTDCKSLASLFDSLEQRRQNCTLQKIFQELDKRLGSMQSRMKSNERESTRAENARILSWICDYMPGRAHQDVMVHKKMGTQYAQSGQWLLNHNELLAWRLAEDHGLSTLWVYGSVGTGKTSLVARVIEWHLQGFQPEKSETCGAASREHRVDQRMRQANSEYLGSIAYFYCLRQGQDQSGTDPAVILSSLVRQLAWSLDGSSISPSVRTFYDSLQYERPDGGHLSLEECSGLLTELISSCSITTIILDALDECEKPYELLRALKTVADSGSGQIKLFVSSRPNVNVASVLSRCSKIDIQIQGNSKDMDIFLHTEVKQGDRRLLQGRFPDLEDKLIEILRDRAQGMFRWAELQLAIFLDENTPFRLAEDVISKLDLLESEVGLPDLDLVYSEIYQKNTRVHSRDRENAIKTFNFMLYSFVNWNIHDLANAISLDVGGGFKEELHSAINASYVLEICSNFLVVDGRDGVQFAHLSVPEYLKGDGSAIVFSDIDAHAQMAEVCLTYVMSPSAQQIVRKRERDRRMLPGITLARRNDLEDRVDMFTRLNGTLRAFEYPGLGSCREGKVKRNPESYYGGIPEPQFLGFHRYALKFCLEHCQLASLVKRQEGPLCRLFTTFMSFEEINPAFLAWVQQKPDNHKGLYARADPQDTFFAACIHGFTEILQDMMRSVVHVDVDRRNERGYPGVFLASKYGQLSVLKLLLDEGANPNIRDDLNGFTPLYDSVLGVRPDIVALLLSRGADASARFKSKRSQVRSYLKNDCEGRETLLHAVIYRVGNSNTYIGCNLIIPMQESQMLSIVSLLREHGASIEAVDYQGQTPLHIACSEDNLLMVSTLLHHGASPGARNRNGYTPLMYSVKRSSTAATELLLTKASITDIVRRGDAEPHSMLSLSLILRKDKSKITMLLLNTVNVRAAQELDTQESEEFVELLQVLKKIDYVAVSSKWDVLRRITWRYSQRSVINCLQAIAENINLGKLDWNDAHLRDVLRKEGVDLDREPYIPRWSMR